MITAIQKELEVLRKKEPFLAVTEAEQTSRQKHRLKKVLVANRGEIAKRFFFLLKEERIPSVAVVTDVDRRQSWFEFADEVVYIGAAANYTNIAVILAAVELVQANAVYPGYGFLSENYHFVEALEELSRHQGREIIFMGPAAEIMRAISNKSDARRLARESGVPLFEASELIKSDDDACKEAAQIGYPVLVKLDAGGGGKGMLPAHSDEQLQTAIQTARRVGQRNYDNTDLYLEKLIEEPVHIEVQIFNGTAVGLRKCAVQRRNQKIIEESAENLLDDRAKLRLLAAAENIAIISGYINGAGAGTVEFLMDANSGRFGFLEVNTRLQVEYPVTDQSLQIDLAKWQVLYFDGREDEIPFSKVISLRFASVQHAMECRIYAEDPWNDFAPAPGVIRDLELPTFNGLRCDFGFRAGDHILPDYDPMIGKLVARGSTRTEALLRMERALSEVYIRGITTNIDQLLQIVRHWQFKAGNYTNLLLNREELKFPNRGERRGQFNRATLAAFAALSFFVAKLEEMMRESFGVEDLENLLLGYLSSSSFHSFNVEVEKKRYDVELCQTSLHVYTVFINRFYYLTAEVHSRIEGEQDFQIMVGSRSFPVRIDRRSDWLSLRVMNWQGEINYHRLKITVSGEGAQSDPPGMVRCPFQGYFVRLEADEKQSGGIISLGSQVSKGAPVIVIEAMKMETTLRAPCEGKIVYIAEEGNLERLIRGYTADGLVLGKNLLEGEPLFIVESETESKKEEQFSEIPPPFEGQGAADAAIFEKLYQPELEDGGLVEIVSSAPGRYLLKVLELIKAVMQGYLQNSQTQERLFKFCPALADLWEHLSPTQLQEAIRTVRDIIDIYLSLKQLYSATLAPGSSHSWLEEMNNFLRYWNDPSYEPIPVFRSTLISLLKHYGLQTEEATSRSTQVRFVILHLLRAHALITRNRRYISFLLPLFEKSTTPSRLIEQILRRLIFEEQRERDSAIGAEASKLLSRLSETYGTQNSTFQGLGIGRKYIREFRSFILQPFSSVPGYGSDFRRPAMRSLKREGKIGEKNIARLYRNGPQWVRDAMNLRISALQKRYELKPLMSPLKELFIYQISLRSDSEQKGYYSIVWLPEGRPLADRNHQQEIVGAQNLERAAINMAKVLRCYDILRPGKYNIVEIMAQGEAIEIDLASEDPTIYQYQNIKRVITQCLRFFLHARVATFLINVTASLPASQQASQQTKQQASQQAKQQASQQTKQQASQQTKQQASQQTKQQASQQARQQTRQQSLSIYLKQGQVCLDLLNEFHPRHPCWDGDEASADYRLLRQDKWPLEYWAQECFDDSFAEIVIPSIDLLAPNDSSSTDGSPRRKVGAKIYSGKIEGSPALFFMKDSRISGGATGDWEGRKYAAALYLAYVRDVPLYIWNDGAGANVKQGMVSLNRAGTGFMMNALTSNRVPYSYFFAATKAYQDRDLVAMFSEMDRLFPHEQSSVLPRNFFLTAVGIGSSTGLDVYGSSQAAIQIMVDAEASYRVLTGSVVIKSVTGEDLTNYEIGGAQVMSQNGTVDIAAIDKLELIYYIRKIQRIFYGNYPQNSLPAKAGIAAAKAPFAAYDAQAVLHEDTIHRSVDRGEFLSFKPDFHQARSLLGCFARLGGRRCLIMGPRTHFGIRSSNALIKAQELIRISAKTNSPQILVIGQNWYRSLANEDDLALRTRMSLTRSLQAAPGPRILIAVHPDSFRRAVPETIPDITIAVLSPRESQPREGQQGEELARKLATFVVSSLEEGFALSGKILYLLDHDHPRDRNFMLGGVPTLPGEQQPFNMRNAIIEPLCDKDSFLLFHHMGEGPALESNLITGLATIEGLTVGIMADQPLYGGAPDAPGTEKFTHFIQFLAKYKLPLVMLSNAPGFVPGVKQERLRIQQIGGFSLDVNVLSAIPVASVVLNQNYGGRQIHAFSKMLRPGIAATALSGATLAVMGAQASFDLFHGKHYRQLLSEKRTEEAEKYRLQALEEFRFKSRADQDALKTEAIDWTFEEPKDLRLNVLRALKLARERLPQTPELDSWQKW